MTNLRRMDEERFKLLHRLWEKTGGNTNSVYPLDALGDDLGLNSTALRDAVLYLSNEGLIKGIDHMMITQAGVREVEAAQRKPQAPTDHFPPHIVNITIQSMTNSQLQVGTTSSTQTQQIVGLDLKELATFLAQTAGAIPKLELSDEEREAVAADTKALQVQANSTKPRSVNWFRETLGAVRDALARALTNATVSAVGGFAQAELPKLISQADRFLKLLGS